MRRRSVLTGALALALAGGACGPGPSASAPAPTQAVVKLKVGVVGTTGFSPFQAGTVLGIFPRDGFEVEIIEHRGGAEAAQALVGSGIDIFQGDFSHALRLNQQGQQIRVFAGVSDRHGYTLVGAPGTAPGIAGLKGKKIGITSPGSQTDNSMRWLLKTNGLDPDKDVELVAIGGGTPMVAAVQNKQVYAGMVVQPFTAQLKLQHYVTLYDFATDAGPYQGLVMMAKQSWLKQNEDAVRRFLKSYLQVVRLLHDDPEARAKVVRDAFPQLDAKVAEAAAAEVIKAYSKEGRVDEAGVQRVFEFDRVARNLTERVPPLSEFADFGYLPR